MNEELSAKNDNSTMARLIAKIIDNLQLSINRVHIRFEDHSSCPGHDFAAGLILEKLYLFSPEQKKSGDVLPGVMQKKVELSRFGIYWDFDESARIQTNNAESIQREMSLAFTDAASVPSEKRGLYPTHWIIDPISLSLFTNADIRKVELRKPEVSVAIQEVLQTLQWSEKVSETKRLVDAYKHIREDEVRGRTAEQEWALMRAYLEAEYPGMYHSDALKVAEDFCFRCWDVSNRPNPIMEISGDVNQVMVQLDQKQYRDMLGFISSLNTQTLRARYKQFKPTKDDPESNPRKWWRFAIKSVMWENAKKRANKGWDDYVRFKKLRTEYIELYKLKSQDKDLMKKDPKTIQRLEKLESKLSLENILLFRKIAMQEIEHEAQIKKKKQQKQQQQQQKESGESKKEKGFLRKLFKKKQKETEEDGLTEEDLQWDESKKLELLAEFDIQPNEMSPWEGGRPTDIQLTAQLRIPKMGIVLTTEHTSLLVCSLEQLGVQVTKMKKYTQVYSCIEGLRVENGSQESEKWPYLVYTEQDALVDTNCVTRFLPEGLYTQERSLPFLQMAVELPSLQKDVDVTVKLQTLPLCVVANTACVMELAAFFIPELAKLNFAALSVSASSIYSQLSSSSKLRLKASKEVLSHKTLGLDVFMGALHMIIPEDIRQDVTHTQSLVVRCGDLRVFSDPRRVSVDEELSEENIYDRIDVSVMRMSMLMTNQHADWARTEVQQKFDLCVVDNFDVQCQIGLSISPSTAQFATTLLQANMNMIHIRLTKTKCISLTRYLFSLLANVSEIIAHSRVDFSGLTKEAKILVSNTLAAANRKEIDNTSAAEQKSEERIESIYSEEEQRLLQQNRILSLNATFEGVNVLIEEVSAANEHTKLVDSTVAGLNVCVETRTYDVDVSVSLHKIEVLDCIQTASRRTNKYLILSQPINKQGEICPEEDSKLVKVNVGIVNEASPDYSKAESDVRVELVFGVLSGKNLWLFANGGSDGVSAHDLSSASLHRAYSGGRGYQADHRNRAGQSESFAQLFLFPCFPHCSRQRLGLRLVARCGAHHQQKSQPGEGRAVEAAPHRLGEEAGEGHSEAGKRQRAAGHRSRPSSFLREHHWSRFFIHRVSSIGRCVGRARRYFRVGHERRLRLSLPDPVDSSHRGSEFVHCAVLHAVLRCALSELSWISGGCVLHDLRAVRFDSHAIHRRTEALLPGRADRGWLGVAEHKDQEGGSFVSRARRS